MENTERANEPSHAVSKQIEDVEAKARFDELMRLLLEVDAERLAWLRETNEPE